MLEYGSFTIIRLGGSSRRFKFKVLRERLTEVQPDADTAVQTGNYFSVKDL